MRSNNFFRERLHARPTPQTDFLGEGFRWNVRVVAPRNPDAIFGVCEFNSFGTVIIVWVP